MKKCVQVIGSIVLSAIAFSIPILVVCAFVFNWNSFFTILFILMSMLEFWFVASLIYDEVTSDD